MLPVPSRHALVALVALGLFWGAAPLRAQPFVANTEDVPLMRELVPVAGSDLVFDKPEGRIIEAQARGKVTRLAVRHFYGTTLPQLGWAGRAGDTWTREAEALHLDFAGSDGDLTVTFTLSPKK